jgi:hypothetical protein
MPSKLLTEWMAYFSIESEEQEKSNLRREASQGEEAMRAKRKR